MKGYVIEGGRRLEGEVRVSGAKNAALPLMAASILSTEPLAVCNVPRLRDVQTFASLLGNVLGDFFVALVDPRVRFGARR